MAVIIQIRNDIAANWTEANPVLASGEIGIETDTKKTKMGDGSTTWNNLPYLPWSGAVDSVNGKTGVVVLDAEDVGALPYNTFIPTKTSDIQNDSGFITASELEGYATESWVGQQGFLTSTALEGYATETWVGKQGYLTSTALEGYATEQWVGQQGYITGITSSDVTTALGYTPYNNSNPNGYQANVLEGVQLAGTDLTIDVNKKVNIPVATNTTYGVAKVFSAYGITIISGTIAIQKPTDDVISQKVNSYQPIVPANLDVAIREGLGNNSLTWTEAYKTSARNTIGAEAQATIQTLSATDSITLADNTIYNGGEQTALTIALHATVDVSFLCEIDFTSGTTATTLAYPNTIKWLGDDVANNVFVPVASKRYTVIVAYDGVNYRATVKGVA